VAVAHRVRGKDLSYAGSPATLWPVLGERRFRSPRLGVMSRVIGVIAFGFTLSACTTAMPGLDFLKSAPQSETLAIESEPPGAEAKTALGQSCRTPCQLSVQPGSEFSVTLALSGYQPQTVSVRPEMQDASSAPRLAPNPVHVTLQAVKPPKKPVAKKKTPVVTAARPATRSPMASAAPTPPPAPAVTPSSPAPTETAPSATNYPWPSR
jgi:PEGA domain